MSNVVCNGSLLKCSFGTVPVPMIVLPVNRVLTNNQPAANIQDNKPLINIPSFGLCTCPANPEVAAATAAAMGVLTPMPCIPATVAPWVPTAPNVNLAKIPIVVENSKLMCSYGGIIAVEMTAQLTVSAK